MKGSIALTALLMSIAAMPMQAATWGAEAVFGTLGPPVSGGQAKVEDGVYTESSINGPLPSRPSEGTVQVTSAFGGAFASIEEGRIELEGFAPSGAATFGWVYDTLFNFQQQGDKGFSLGYILEFEVDPFEFPNFSDVPIALLGLSIQGGGVSAGFSLPIYGCSFTNACATSDVLRFPKTTSEIKIGFSLSAFSDAPGLPVVHDYYARFRMGVAEFCEVDGVRQVCAVPYDSASGFWMALAPPLPVSPVPLPPAVVLLGGALAGLSAVKRGRRDQRRGDVARPSLPAAPNRLTHAGCRSPG